MNSTEKKMYKVLRNVGVKRNYIVQAANIEDLYLDDYDFRLLVFYFENEFNVVLKEREIRKLTNLTALYHFLKMRRIDMN
ncbi:MAG TPA: hypothetical protein PLK12_09185 [Prolixibacteraceae bacterium]|nr:hypothetical protein [Prolixibacteraceae bacterium]